MVALYLGYDTYESCHHPFPRCEVVMLSFPIIPELSIAVEVFGVATVGTPGIQHRLLLAFGLTDIFQLSKKI